MLLGELSTKTPIQLSIKSTDRQCFELLLDNGADVLMLETTQAMKTILLACKMVHPGQSTEHFAIHILNKLRETLNEIHAELNEVKVNQATQLPKILTQNIVWNS